MTHSGDNDSGSQHNDTLYLNPYIPGLPAVSVAYNAASGQGSIYDNHGNTLSGHDLFVLDRNEKGRHYHLTDAQLNNIILKISPHSDDAARHLRLGNKIPVLNHQKSPLEVMGNELEAQGAPYTPAVPKNVGKDSHQK